MSPILFLDIDGVLATKKEIHLGIGISNRIDDYGYAMNPGALSNLSCIVQETGCKIVLSSSWRIHGLEWMQGMWEHRHYPGEIIDVTGHEDFRSLEILEWLEGHKEVINWCAIDDELLFENDANSRKHHVNVHYGFDNGGLTAYQTDMAIRILRGDFGVPLIHPMSKAYLDERRENVRKADALRAELMACHTGW